jgi:hypothetical protein
MTILRTQLRANTSYITWLPSSIFPPSRLSLYRGEEVTSPHMSQRVMLVEAYASGRATHSREVSHGSGQTKCSPWHLRHRVERGANDLTSEEISKSPERSVEGGKETYKVPAPVNKERVLVRLMH